MDFFNSSFGQYIAQTVFHATVIAITVESMLSLWRIQKPLLQMKFRLLVLLLPILYLPFYYALYPTRTGAHFHSQVAIIDLNRWLGLRLIGHIALWHFFAAIILLTTIYFLFNEAIPGLRYYFWHRHSLPVKAKGQFPGLDAALASLAHTGLPVPAVFLSAETMPIIYTIGRRALVLSATTLNTLDSDELEAAVAHELAHLTGWAYVTNQLLLVLRFVMFYNPVALLVFRRLINDTENLCDDIAVTATGKPLALASALLKVARYSALSPRVTAASAPGPWLPPRIRALPEHAHRELTKRRIERLAYPEKVRPVLTENIRLGITAILLVALLFFVV